MLVLVEIVDIEGYLHQAVTFMVEKLLNQVTVLIELLWYGHFREFLNDPLSDLCLEVPTYGSSKIDPGHLRSNLVITLSQLWSIFQNFRGLEQFNESWMLSIENVHRFLEAFTICSPLVHCVGHEVV